MTVYVLPMPGEIQRIFHGPPNLLLGEIGDISTVSSIESARSVLQPTKALIRSLCRTRVLKTGCLLRHRRRTPGHRPVRDRHPHIANAGDLLLGPIRRAVEDNVIYGTADNLHVEPWSLGENVGLLGAAASVRSRLSEA